jgi:hypothetical protein
MAERQDIRGAVHQVGASNEPRGLFAMLACSFLQRLRGAAAGFKAHV